MRIVPNQIYNLLTDGGIEKLSQRLDQLQTSGPVKSLLYKLQKSQIGLSGLAFSLLEHEKELDSLGIAQASRNLLTRSGMLVSIDNRLSNNDLLKKNSRVLFVGLNHESFIEPIILYSLLDRDDIRLIAISFFRQLGRNFSKYLLPVLPKICTIDYNGQRGKKILGLDVRLGLYETEGLNLAQANKMNSHSLAEAARYLDKNHAVTLYPASGKSIGGSWFPGIGKIINLMSDRKSPLPVVAVEFRGLGKKKLLSHLRRVYTGKPSILEMQVIIYPEINYLSTSKNPLAITEELYQKVMKTISFHKLN